MAQIYGYGDARRTTEERRDSHSERSAVLYAVTISRVTLIGNLSVLHSAVWLASRGRTRSVSQK
jgi:hypothetical protein